MLNKQPVGDMWYLQDRDIESQNYGKTFIFDFSVIDNPEIKTIVKDYIWQNCCTNNKTLRTLYADLSQLRYFLSFAKKYDINSFKELNNTKIDLFLSYLRTTITNKAKKPLSYKYQKTCLDSLKSVIYWCRIHHPNDAPPSEIFTGNEFSGINRRMKIDFIPDEVMAQINVALKTEKNPYLKNFIIILKSTGMRMGDLLNLQVDCMKPHVITGYTISWFDHKNRKERQPMPITTECAKAIQEMIEITKPLREEANDEIKDKLFIYRYTNGAFAGDLTVLPQPTLKQWLKQFSKKHKILNTDGTTYNLSTHQFRRTLGTDMLSKGTDLNVIQQVLGHSNPSVTKRFYADVKDKERAEVFSKIGIIGNINLLDKSSFESHADFDWFINHKDTTACMCDGYCTKPFANGEICERLLKRQKCYSCSRYITTPEYLQAHRDHLARLEKQLVDGAIYGEHYAEHFLPTIEVLRTIIERLEDLQNGRNESGVTASGH